MALREELSRSGNFLFRWRSYLPLCMIFFILLALHHSDSSEDIGRLDDFWSVICMIVSLCGLVMRIATIGYTPNGTSGTNTKRQIADSLNIDGMYSITRNPLYLGNFFIGLGIFMLPRLWWFCLLFVLMFWIYYERIIFAEEEFLRKKFGRLYLDWSAKTPAFIPNLKTWNRSVLSFSCRRALRNEYKTYYTLVMAFCIFDVLDELYLEHRFEMETFWQVVFGVSTLFFLTVRILKKKTRLLDLCRR
jgi:protein-S-isoprenylcysteine O-methyltransferase Ste14